MSNLIEHRFFCHMKSEVLIDEKDTYKKKVIKMLSFVRFETKSPKNHHIDLAVKQFSYIPFNHPMGSRSRFRQFRSFGKIVQLVLVRVFKSFVQMTKFYL